MSTFVLVARAREDTEKIDHNVKKRAERLHHVATVRNPDFVSVPKTERDENLWTIFPLVTGVDSEKYSWIEIEKSCRQALEWWRIRGQYCAFKLPYRNFEHNAFILSATYLSSSWVAYFILYWNMVSFTVSSSCFYLVQADLKRADFAAKRRAMEDSLMALEVLSSEKAPSLLRYHESNLSLRIIVFASIRINYLGILITDCWGCSFSKTFMIWWLAKLTDRKFSVHLTGYSRYTNTSRLKNIILCRKRDPADSSEGRRHVTLEKNGINLEFIPWEVSKDRIAAVQVRKYPYFSTKIDYKQARNPYLKSLSCTGSLREHGFRTFWSWWNRLYWPRRGLTQLKANTVK